jgi:hypothetical protein
VAALLHAAEIEWCDLNNDSLDCIIDVWLVLPLELDGLGIAATLNVEHTCGSSMAWQGTAQHSTARQA